MDVGAKDRGIDDRRRGLAGKRRVAAGESVHECGRAGELADMEMLAFARQVIGAADRFLTADG